MKVWAKDVSRDAIQAAVDVVVAAGEAGTVYVPAGDISWGFHEYVLISPSVGLPIEVMGAGIDQTIIRSADGDDWEPFHIEGSGFARISGFTIISLGNLDSTYRGIAVEVPIASSLEFRIDHCKFVNCSKYSIGVFNEETGSTMAGLIDHCKFENPYMDIISAEWAYGILLYAGSKTWEDINTLLGQYHLNSRMLVYIEDSDFSRCRHAVGSNGGAWYVIRHCILWEPRPKNFGMIDVHGLSGETSPGGRGLEAYNNIIYGASDYDFSQAFWIRGGSGVIFNNDMYNIQYGVGLYKEYEDWKVQNLYVWNNAMDRGTLINNDAGYTEGADYFLGERAGYVPYVYPHPLAVVPTTPIPLLAVAAVVGIPIGAVILWWLLK